MLGPAWSLCYEEQFYLVVGAALLVSRNRLFQVLAFITAAVGVLCIVAPGFGDGLFIDGRWLLFAAGVGVYYERMYACRWEAILIYSALACGLIWTAWDVRALMTFNASREQERVVGVLFAGLLVVLWRYDAQIARARVLGPIASCGTMCYSLYLVHWPICKAISHGMNLAGATGMFWTVCLTVPLCVAASVAVARVFFLAVERRFLSGPKGDTIRLCELGGNVLGPSVGPRSGAELGGRVLAMEGRA
jgi:peptidoglycan/LPS O-acetylase OafA/YrhL